MTQLGLSQSTVAGILKRLEKKSLLIRQADEQDARKSRILLTAEGLALEETLKVIAAQTEDILLQGMTDDEQAQLNRLLQVALDNIGALRGGALRGAEPLQQEKRP